MLLVTGATEGHIKQTKKHPLDSVEIIGDLGKCGFHEVVERRTTFQCFRSELENQVGDTQS